MKGMEVRDAAEVARARAGDTDAFRQLVERHSRAVFRLAFRMTGNEQDAEDVVQEAFLKAYRRLDTFESKSQFGSWLHRIAANCAYDLLRSRARRDEQPLDPDPEDDGHAPQQPVAETPAPDRLVWSGEVSRRVKSAMGRLSSLEKSAFVLRHFEGMTMEEIGGVLGVEPGAAKHTVFRAVRKLREALEPLVAS
jgi:RNA polymerase sigma-70 factor, ECF subfamily